MTEYSDNTNSLTYWKNPPTVADLENDLISAEPSHSEHVAKVEKWLDNLAAKLKVNPPKGRSRVQPKLIRTQAEWRYSALEEPFLSSRDIFEVSPRTYEDVSSAQDNQLVLNYQWNTKIDKVAFINEYIRTAVDEGTVIVQVGWEYEEEEREVDVDIEATPEQMKMYLLSEVQRGTLTEEEAIARIQSGKPMIIGTRKEKKIVAVKNNPTYRVCEYDRVVIDPTCEGNLDKAQFIIMPFETSMSDLRRDGSYKNLDKIFDVNKINPNGGDEEFLASRRELHGFEFKDKARKKLTAYEYYGYWDIDGTGITKPIKAVWIANSDVMIKLEELPYPDKKLPFVAVQYLPVRKSVYGEPDGALLEDKQDIMGAISRGMIDIMGRSANGQIAMSKGFLDVVNQKRFDNGDHFFYNQGFDPRTAIHMQSYPEIPSSAINMLQMLNLEAESLTGVKAYSNGISSQSLGNVVAGIRGALDSASKRELGILRRLSKGIEKIGRKTIAMNAVWLNDEEVIRITNKEFRTIKRDDLNGDYDLNLSISTAESDNNKAQELAFMLQTTAQSSDPEEVRMIRAEIARLRKMPELAKRIEDFKPQVDPMQQRMQELQVAMLEAQVKNEIAKAGENAVDIELKRAKTQSELAKAGKVNSEKDLNDQKFLAEDSGINHVKELEKQNTQRLGKLDEIAMKAAVAQPKVT
ncbi:MAG: chromosome partitioning protein ParB [Epsilonproteobacteria bacterium]|nr:chromosome partitioning protein ParB [Campylobacterota bacterium]